MLKYSGTRAGEVTAIVIDPDQQMHADVYIRGVMKDFVRRDSTATIRKRFGVAGDAYLEISRGIREALDWEYAVLTASADRAPTETLQQVLAELRDKALPIIDDTANIVTGLAALADRLQDPEGDLQQFLANLNAVSGKLERGEGAVGRLLAEATLVTELETLLQTTNTSMAKIGPILDELQDQREIGCATGGKLKRAKFCNSANDRASASRIGVFGCRPQRFTPHDKRSSKAGQKCQ